MNRRATTIAALLIWGTGVLLSGAGLLLLFLNRSTWSSPLQLFTDAFVIAAGGLTYTTVGAFLFARFPRNPITWIFWVTGLMLAYIVFSNEYAIHGLVVAPGSLPAVALVFWLVYPLTVLAFPMMLAFLMLLFPNGRLPSRAWAIVLVVDLAVSALQVFWSLPPVAVTRSLVRNVPMHLGWPDAFAPLFAIKATGPWQFVDSHTGVLSLVQLVAILAGLAAILWRLWHSSGPERQQLKWLGYMLTGTTVASVLFFVGQALLPDRYAAASTLSPVGVGFLIVTVFFIFGIPGATLIAITKYRLYDIDLVINKTLVYGFLALVISGVYVLVVVNIGALIGGNQRFWLSLVATALIAIMFQPVRGRAQRLANRLVYGKRATPYEALSQLNEHLASAYGGEEVLDRMTRILAEATGAERAELWVKTGHEFVRTSAWPAAPSASYPMSNGRLPEIGADKVVPVTRKGQLLGALAVTKHRGESLSPLEEKLLADLASQAGLVLENAGLNRELLARLQDLRASRQRLVTAQDEERRRIERNLHDGAQQELVALTVQLSLLERVVQKDPEKAKAMAADLRGSAVEALETLRELAHGIYPPLLASEGLATALQQQVRKSPVPVDLDVRHFPRQEKEVEAATYFCCLEALQNMAKHAGASSACIRLWADGGDFHFEVQDNGQGFDPATAGRSAGLQNMQDRMEALGGSLEIRSRPGAGTTIAGSTPLRPPPPEPV